MNTLVSETYLQKCSELFPRLFSLLREKNFRLFMNFLERETADYHRADTKHVAWIDQVLVDINKSLEGQGDIHELEINSYGNTGVHLRRMTLDTYCESFSSKRVIVELCTCGKPDHWGSIRFTK